MWEKRRTGEIAGYFLVSSVLCFVIVRKYTWTFCSVFPFKNTVKTVLEKYYRCLSTVR